MKVHLVGFDWELGKGVTIDEFFRHLRQKEGEQFE
jgi:hypothetical protein